MKSEEVMKIFARGENQPNLFTIHFYFLHRVPIGDAMPIVSIAAGFVAFQKLLDIGTTFMSCFFTV